MGRTHSDKSALWIVGAGHLGVRIAQHWFGRGNPVIAETMTTKRHPLLRALGVTPRLREEPAPSQAQANMLFAIPPSKTENYEKELLRALSLWNHQGTFLFISSSGIYPTADETYDEASPIGEHAKAKKMEPLEAIVKENGGTVLRLAGLYDEERGPHRVYDRKRSIDKPGGGLVNLIHYADACSLAIAILSSDSSRRLYLGCDNEPLTRSQIAELYAASGLASNRTPCQFSPPFEPSGKRLNNNWTCKTLDWSPHFSSFRHWVASIEA